MNVVIQANTAPRLCYFAKKTYERGQAKKSGLFKCSLQFQALGCYCMADLHPDKFLLFLKCKVKESLSRNRFENGGN